MCKIYTEECLPTEGITYIYIFSTCLILWIMKSTIYTFLCLLFHDNNKCVWFQKSKTIGPWATLLTWETVPINKHICAKQWLRLRNINLQDWKYTSFVIFIRHSQNIQQHSGMGGDWLVADVVVQSRFSFHLFYAINREYL